MRIRTVKSILAAACAATLLVACGSNYASSAGTSMAYEEAAADYDYAAAEEYDTADNAYKEEAVGAELERIKNEYASIYEGQTCGPVGAVVGCTEESDAQILRNAYPELFFLIPGYGAQGGAARIAATLLLKAGGTVNSSRGILCAWKKSEDCIKKSESGNLTLSDIADAAQKAAIDSKADLQKAVSEL